MSIEEAGPVSLNRDAAVPLKHLVTCLQLLHELLLRLHVALCVQGSQQICRTGECMSGLHDKTERKLVHLRL